MFYRKHPFAYPRSQFTDLWYDCVPSVCGCTIVWNYVVGVQLCGTSIGVWHSEWGYWGVSVHTLMITSVFNVAYQVKVLSR